MKRATKHQSFLRLFAAAAAVFAAGISARAAQTGHVVYRPGLVQARIPFPSSMGYPTAYDGVPTLASNLLENAESSWLDRTLDVFKDGEHPNAAVNPVSGNAWPWLIEHNHGVFAYEGEMFVQEGVEYSFYGRSDTGEALVVDGETVVWQGSNRGWQYGPEIHRRWTAPKTGWVPFNAWLWSWNGEFGIQWSTWSLQYNLQGVAVTFLDPSDRLSDRYDSLNSWLEENRGLTNVWQRFADPGDGTFLRTATTNLFTTLGASEAVAGGRSFSLSFADVPADATLVAFTGPYDGGHATSEWAAVSAALAQVPAGDSTATVTVPLAADAKVLRFRLATGADVPADGVHPFEEWTEMVAVSPSPVVRLDSAAPGYTNVVVAGSIGSFGLGGSSGTVKVEVAAADDAAFATPVVATNLPAVSSVGPFAVELFGLATNTAYLVRASATNDLGVAGVSSAVPVLTSDPGPAAASLAVSVAAFQGATFAATVSGWGGGSSGAESWIDVSKDAGFPAGATQTTGPVALSGRLPATASVSASGLDSATEYFARLRVVNSWGVETASETVSFSTADEPIEFPAPTATAGRNQVSASLAPLFVADGTVYDVELGVEGYAGALQTWKNQTGYGPFERTLSLAGGHALTFVYTIAWNYEALGLAGTNVLRATATSKLADIELDALPKIDPASGGVYLRPGDTVAVSPTAGARVDWHTNAVLSVMQTNGVFIVEALEPGATLLYESGPDGKPNGVTGVAIVVPAGNPAGGVYVHRGFEDFNWTDPYAWDMVVAGPQGYPNAVGAVAYVVAPQISEASGPSDHMIEIPEPITLGHLAVGQLGRIHHYYNDKTQFYLQFVDTKAAGGSFLFKTGDGSASWIRLLGHCYVTSPLKMNVPVTLANDLDLDALGRIPDSDGWKSWRDHGFKINAPLDFGPYTFRTIRDTYYYGRWNLYSRGFVTVNDDIRGSGTIRLEADTAVGMNDGSDAFRLKSFTGVWDVANGQFNTTGYGGCGLFFGDAGLGNASEIIFRGAWHPADASENKGAHSRSGQSGESAWTNDWTRILPPKVTLDGGWIVLGPRGGTMDAAAKAACQATGIRRACYQMSELVVPAGPQGRIDTVKYGTTADYPHNIVEITNLVRDASAVLSFSLGASSDAVSNRVSILEGPAGAYEDPDEDVQFLPFLFANYEANDNKNLIFRDAATGLLENRTAGTAEGSSYRRWTAAAELADGSEWAAMMLAANVTNSFAPGAAVRNLAGYLDMRGGSALGRPGRDAEATVDFGAHPACVYVGKRADTAAAGCRLAGTAGLVKGGSGTFAAGASLAGMKGGIRVAGGTLKLGAEGGVPPRAAGDVVVEAGSRVEIPAVAGFNSHSHFGGGSRLVLNDREWIPSYAHVLLETDSAVSSLVIGGEPVAPGTWGSSESGAENVDDVHFSGPGVLMVRSTGLVEPTLWIIRGAPSPEDDAARAGAGS